MASKRRRGGPIRERSSTKLSLVTIGLKAGRPGMFCLSFAAVLVSTLWAILANWSAWPEPPLVAIMQLCSEGYLNCQAVPRVPWNKSFWPAETPVVLTASPAQHWVGMDALRDGQGLAALAEDKIMHNIYARRNYDHVFSYWHHKPLGDLPELDGEAQRRLAIDVLAEMDSAEFFRRTWGCERRCGTPLYYSNPIQLDFKSLLRQLGGKAGLEWLSPPRRSESPSQRRQSMLWIGCGGTTTPLHNDAYVNAYVQLRGEKHFVLFPPRSHRSLHLFPALHPKHQQSQALLHNISLPTEPDPVAWASDSIPSYLPNFRSLAAATNSERPFSVTLTPGDVLVIPELWFHHVTSLSASLSLNVWTTSDEADAFKVAFGAHDAVENGCLTGENQSKRVMTAMAYLEALVGEVLLRLNGTFPDSSRDQETTHNRAAKNFVRDVVLVPRYFPLLETGAVPSFADPTKYLFCDERGHSEMSEKCATCVSAQAGALLTFAGSATDGTRQARPSIAKLELQLADVTEYTALWAVGPELVSAFLLDFARCYGL